MPVFSKSDLDDLEVAKFDTLFITFIECNVKGIWQTSGSLVSKIKKLTDWQTFRAMDEETCQVWVISPDGLRRGWSFKTGSLVSIGSGILRFERSATVNDLTVDEKEQSGKGKTRETL